MVRASAHFESSVSRRKVTKDDVVLVRSSKINATDNFYCFVWVSSYRRRRVPRCSGGDLTKISGISSICPAPDQERITSREPGNRARKRRFGHTDVLCPGTGVRVASIGSYLEAV
jgi:hypothetical protein